MLAPARDVEIGFGAATLEILIEGTDPEATGVITVLRESSSPYAVQVEEPRLTLSVAPESDMVFVASVAAPNPISTSRTGASTTCRGTRNPKETRCSKELRHSTW